MQKQRRVKNFSPPSRPQESALKARIRAQNIAGGTCRQTKNSPQPDNEKRSRARMHSAGALKLPPHSPQPFNARPLQNKNILNAPPRGRETKFSGNSKTLLGRGLQRPKHPTKPGKTFVEFAANNFRHISPPNFSPVFDGRFARDIFCRIYLPYLCYPMPLNNFNTSAAPGKRA